MGPARATAVSTLVGQPPGPEWADGQGAAATFQRPLAVDAQGNNDYVGGHRDGAGARARFNNPTALTIGPDGTLYVADSGNQCIRVVREVK